ncbi:MAG: hypothetical protein MRJ68_07800 [Nitrospira sp.]|nr:hypothetical protein [Nitrospira sp.]
MNVGIDWSVTELRTKLIAAFIGFSLIPTVLLAVLASGLVNKVVDVWFSEHIEKVINDSYEVARMQHAGHVSLAVNSARAISQELFREDLLIPEQRDLLIAAMARKRMEYGVAGIEVFSNKMETLTKALDADIPVGVLELPISQLVLQVINGEAGVHLSVQEAQTGRLVRAAIPWPPVADAVTWKGLSSLKPTFRVAVDENGTDRPLSIRSISRSRR